MSTQIALYSALDEIQPLLQTRLPERLPVREDLLQQLHEQRTRVMIFGAYNAGKSSLVNTLVGEEVAHVGDVPTTSARTNYLWDERLLIDTPGVNAPIAHELVTEETLCGAQMVLFVVREGDQDVANVYERLFHLLSAEKPVLLVINHALVDAAEAEVLRKRTNDILVQQADQRGFDFELLKSLPVLLMNVDLALHGRLQQNEVFLRDSGFNDVCASLQQWLANCENQRDSVQRIATNAVRELLLPLVLTLEQDSGPLHHATQVSEDLARMERRLSHFNQHCESQLGVLVRKARVHIGAQLDGCEGRQEVLEAGLQQVLEDVNQQMTVWLAAELQPIAEDLARYLERAGLSSLEVDPISENTAGFGKLLGDTLAQASVMGLRSVKPEHIVKLLLEGRRLKLPLLKGRWEKTFGVWAGKAMPWIQAAAAAVEITLELREQAKKNAEARTVVLQRQQWINETAGALQRMLQESLSETQALVETDLLDPLRQRRAALQQEQSTVQRQITNLRGMVQRLEAEA